MGFPSLLVCFRLVELLQDIDLCIIGIPVAVIDIILLHFAEKFVNHRTGRQIRLGRFRGGFLMGKICLGCMRQRVGTGLDSGQSGSLDGCRLSLCGFFVQMVSQFLIFLRS